jgi:hypothetical protein
MSQAKPADISAWLRRETPEHLRLMERLRTKLGETMTVDINACGTPSRDWARCFQRYQATYTALLVEERERFKLRLAMSKQGEGLIDDAEYAAGLQELALESIQTLPDDALQKELERRALQAPQYVEREEDD